MSITIQQVNPETEEVTAIAEFELRGDGVHATYHSPRVRREFERDGIWTLATGKLRPSDGQVFLDALPKVYARSSTMRVVDNHAGAARTDRGKTSYADPDKATQPDPNTAPEPWVQGDSGDWDESKHPREGGKFAPKGGGDQPAPKGRAGDGDRRAAAESAARAKSHAAGLRRVADKHPEHEPVAAQAEEHAHAAAEHARAAAKAQDPAEAEHQAHLAHHHAAEVGSAHESLKSRAESALEKLGGGGEAGKTWRSIAELMAAGGGERAVLGGGGEALFANAEQAAAGGRGGAGGGGASAGGGAVSTGGEPDKRTAKPGKPAATKAE